ncbi:MAG: O-antigen ligase family protein [Deltaproteobacteria bacterium]|nr:O-antigen ligase family protein [Deltaproteobacteria bacterium]
MWLKALGLFAAIYVLASLAGNAPIRSLGYTANLIYILAVFPLTWLAVSQYPQIRRLIPLMYAFGLMVCAFMALQEARWGLVCVRAKAHIGIIELGSILGQLSPIMVGAVALSLRRKEKLRAGVFLLALAASYVAMRISCSRIGMIAAPALSVMVFAVNWRAFGWKGKLTALALIAAVLITTLGDPAIMGRFKEMGEASGNRNNEQRLFKWRMGWTAFNEHPVLGNGPGAVPQVPPAEIPILDDGLPLFIWKEYTTAHQVFIQVLAESGIIGLIGFLALHLVPLFLMRKNLRSRDPETFFWTWSAVAVTGQFVLNAMTDNIFGLRPLMYIYWTTTAMALWPPSGGQKAEGH